MATLRRYLTRNGVRWIAIVRLAKAPIVRQGGFRSKESAKRWATRVEAGIREGYLLPQVEAARHTVSDAIKKYLDETDPIPVGRESQLEWWEKRLKDVTLDKLTPARIRDALAEKRGVSVSTRNRYLAALSSVMQDAHLDWQWIPENPVRRVRREKEPRGRLRILSEAEREDLLKACGKSKDRRLRPLVVLALVTGARRGELLALRWADVDIPKARAIVEDSKNRDRRTLHLHGDALSVVRDLKRTPSFTGYVFGTGRRGRPSFPEKEWKAALKRAKIRDFRFHDLRHTAASYLAMSGATLAEIAAFLGHRTLAMVKRYAHLTDQHVGEVSKRMVDAYLSQPDSSHSK